MPLPPVHHRPSCLILGHGLAGACVAWQLHWRGLSFCVVDEDAEVTSSKIAAGLLTPITGMRIALSPNHAEELLSCIRFYRRAQQELDQRFLHVRSHVRVLRSEKERLLWEKRQREAAVQRFASGLKQPLGECYAARGDAFQMQQGGWVNTADFLAASRRLWLQQERWQTAQLEPEQIPCGSGGWNWQGQTWDYVIDCRGWVAGRSARWDWLPWESMKGSILDLKADLGDERRILHHGCWIVPQGYGRLRAGATYSRDLRAPFLADEAQVDDLRREISQNLTVPWEVTTVRTAVRPILARQRIVAGRHPGNERLAVLNGLGSKGALRAPGLAQLLIRHLAEGARLPADLDPGANF
jgi:glycine oxidase